MLIRLFALSALLLPFAVAQAQDDHPAVALVKSKVKDTSKPFALVVTIKVKSGKEKQLEEAFAPCIKATKKEPGCLAYELNRDTDHAEMYVMYEKFKSLDALKDHLAKEHTKTLLAAIPALMDGELKVKVYGVPE